MRAEPRQAERQASGELRFGIGREMREASSESGRAGEQAENVDRLRHMPRVRRGDGQHRRSEQCRHRAEQDCERHAGTILRASP